LVSWLPLPFQKFVALPVNCRLLRCSASMPSKYGAL
jgi:hypothetical protein